MSKITDVLSLARFPAEACEFFEKIYAKIEADAELSELLERTEKVYLAKEDSESLRLEIAEKLEVHIYTVDMLLMVYCAVGLREVYAERGYSEQLFCGVLTDLRCKLAECKNVHGFWGTFVFRWFYRFYNCTRFMLGRLQYETVEAKYDYKDAVRVGDTVYNCHIPSAGPLTPESVEESLRLAYEFYGIEGVMPVVCHSWLLYPDHYELFGANTRAFADRFDVVATDEQENNGDAWRVFGRGADDLEALPQNTSLQRGFYRYFKEGKKMGNGYGVILYQPENK